MVETRAVKTRPDADIQEDVRDLIAHYPPLVADRRHLTFTVNAGVVIVSGYVKAPSTRRYLLEMLPSIAGVTDVISTDLHDDEALRLELGRVVPPGMIVNIAYGVVILSGRLPVETNEAALVERVKAQPGVRQVVTALRK